MTSLWCSDNMKRFIFFLFWTVYIRITYQMKTKIPTKKFISRTFFFFKKNTTNQNFIIFQIINLLQTDLERPNTTFWVKIILDMSQKNLSKTNPNEP